MSTLRDKIAAVDDATRETVHVPEWDVTLEIRSPLVADRTRLVARFLRIGQTGDAAISWEQLYPHLLAITVYDPDTGERVFADADDAAVLGDKNPIVVDRLVDVAARLSGLDGDGALDAFRSGGVTETAIDAGKGG